MKNNASKPFNIGITGHRFIVITDRLRIAVRQVLEEIIKDNPERELRLFSPLAAGSDQLIAKIAQEFDMLSLVVPLPMPIKDYLLDFEADADRRIFNDLLQTSAQVIPVPSQNDDRTAYQRLGNYLVSQCDVFVAIWNGDFNHKKGGTGEVVKAALDAGKPVYWIYNPNEKSGEENRFFGNKKIGELEILKP